MARFQPRWWPVLTELYFGLVGFTGSNQIRNTPYKEKFLKVKKKRSFRSRRSTEFNCFKIRIQRRVLDQKYTKQRGVLVGNKKRLKKDTFFDSNSSSTWKIRSVTVINLYTHSHQREGRIHTHTHTEENTDYKASGVTQSEGEPASVHCPTARSRVERWESQREKWEEALFSEERESERERQRPKNWGGDLKLGFHFQLCLYSVGFGPLGCIH